MHETLLRSWWMLGVRGSIAVVFGLLALLWPDLNLAWMIALFAAYAVLCGTVWAAGALHNRRADTRWGLTLLLGLTGIAVGVLALAHPAPTTLLLVLLIGAQALATGLLDLVEAARLRKFIRGERLLALSAAASILFGALISAWPADGPLALAWLVGAYALLSGTLLLALALRIRTWSLIHAARSSPAAGAL